MTHRYGNEKELYDCEKQTLTVAEVQQLQQSDDFVEARITYHLEDFSSFAKFRLQNKPEQDTTLELMFVSKPGDLDKIQVVFGYADLPSQEPSNLDPSANSNFTNTLTFDTKLINEIRQETIDSVSDLMDRVPTFL